MEKTCSTCAHCSPCEWSCDSEVIGFNFIVDENDLWCGGEAYEQRDVTKAYTADGKEILTFAGVKLLEAYDRVVKYEQLDQVAKELYGLSVSLFHALGRNDSFCLRATKRKLEALGVSIDD